MKPAPDQREDQAKLSAWTASPVADLVEQREPLVVVLLGPTASGKTSLSLALAEQFGGEIVNCDSVAVYREMEIGTAKPELADRRRIPHHLIDVVSPDQPYTAGDYSRAARAALSDIRSRQHLPIVTGGTGLYLRALVDGLFLGPQRSEPLRERLQTRSRLRPAGWLHRVLARLDPVAATRIHANDTPKLIRAIEVCLSGRQPLTQAWAAGRNPLQGFRILRIGLNPEREALYRRINERAEAMFANGLVEETQSLIARYGAGRPLDSLGYKQARSILSGDLTLPAAIAAAQQGHRNYAKRQFTWFRREPDVRWLNCFGDSAEVRTQAADFVSEVIGS